MVETVYVLELGIYSGQRVVGIFGSPEEAKDAAPHGSTREWGRPDWERYGDYAPEVIAWSKEMSEADPPEYVEEAIVTEWQVGRVKIDHD